MLGGMEEVSMMVRKAMVWLLGVRWEWCWTVEVEMMRGGSEKTC